MEVLVTFGSSEPGRGGDQAAAEGYLSVVGGEIWYGVVGAGGGVPLLTLHGGPGFPHDYLQPLAALGDQRRVVFYDQLGCGRSEQPNDPALWQIERFVDEIARVRDALGLERVLLGRDAGGGLPAHAARGRGERRAGQPLPEHAVLDRRPGRLPPRAAGGDPGYSRRARGRRYDLHSRLRRSLFRLLRPPPLPPAAAAGAAPGLDAECGRAR